MNSALGFHAQKVQFKRPINPQEKKEARIIARDGTNRGGRRAKAGSKPTPLADKLAAGKAGKRIEIHEFEPETLLVGGDIGEGADLEGMDMPDPSEYLSAKQKDGTNRGGRRAKAGSKPTPLADKLAAGKSGKRIEIHEFEPETLLVGGDIGEGAELEGADMPDPSEYLSAKQKDGTTLGADELFRETWLWLKERGCEKLVSPRVLESYAQAFARYIQCEQAVSQYGLLGKHPTTGGVVTSPFVTMSQSFQKQANLLWYEIFDIVKQNCTTDFEGSPNDDMMERLLRSKKGN